MDWKQKYTEAKYKYELDEWFLKQLRELCEVMNKCRVQNL